MSLRFRIFGVPIQVQPWFLLTIVVLNQPIHELTRAQSLVVWAPIVFLGVLFHELGHALVARRFGLRPRIVFSAFFGLTQFEGGRLLTPWRSIAVSVAGPALGLALGALAIPFALGDAPADPMMAAAVDYWLWVNLGWSILNLLPVLPLDGGQIVANLFRLFAPKKGFLYARYLSLGLLGLGLAGALYVEDTWLAVFFGFFGFMNFQAIKHERELAERQIEVFRTPDDLKRFAYAALERGDVPTLLRAGSFLLRSAKEPAMRDEAIHLIAWARLLGGEASLARSALDDLSGERAADPALEGAVQLALGRADEALDLFERALDLSGPSSFVAERYLQAAARVGAMDRVRDFASQHPGLLELPARESLSPV